MRYFILFALIAVAYAQANTASEETDLSHVEPVPIQELTTTGEVPNSLLDVADVGGEQTEEADRVARSYGWGGYGGYKRGYGGYGSHRGGYGGYGGYGVYKRGYGGYGGYRGGYRGGYGGYGYKRWGGWGGGHGHGYWG